MKSLQVLLCLAVTAALVGCNKAPEKAAEAMIESAMQKDGTKAKVDLSAGSAKITTTDASGKTSQMEMGAAKVGESDLGVPFYPGTKPGDGQSSKVSTPDGTMYTVMLNSSDQADKVAAFYRDRLKGMSAGKQFMEMSSGDGGASLVLSDEQTKSMVQVNVMKADKGSDVQIVATKKSAAK